MPIAESRQPTTVFIVVFSVSLLSNLYQALHSSYAALGPGYETAAVARNLALQGSFANPFHAMPTGPTAVVPPLYPAFLASLLNLFGDGSYGAYAAAGFTIIVHSLHAALMPSMSKLLFQRALPGIFAAAVLIVLPIYRIEPQSEAMVYATGVMLWCWGAARQMRKTGPGISDAGMAGAAAGMLLLLNPASLLILVPWVVFLPWWRGVPYRGGIRYVLLCFSFALLVCAPWCLRNYYRLGGMSFIRNGLGLELYISNNDLAHPLSVFNYEVVFPTMHPNVSGDEAGVIREVGETAYMRSRMAIALRWIRNNPRRFAELTLRRAVAFWFPSPLYGRVAAYSIWVITLAGFVGAWILVRRGVKTVWFILGVWALFPLAYYVVQSHPNYRYPILWLSLLTAGYLMQSLTEAAGALSRWYWKAGARRGEGA